MNDHHKHNPKSPLALSMNDFKQLGVRLPSTSNSNSTINSSNRGGSRTTSKNKIVSKQQEQQRHTDSHIMHQPIDGLKESSGEHGEIPIVERQQQDDWDYSLAQLSCKAYGGPPDNIAAEMVYWDDIPSDSKYVSPFHAKKGQHKRYMTFEPDGGGWNNIRMSMETVFALAHAMGRTLVLPPEQRMYLLAQGKNKQKKDFTFTDFFPVEELAKEHVGLEIITMEEFLIKEALAGNLIDKDTGKPSFPPDNKRTNWNGQNGKQITLLKEWLRNVTHVPLWRPGQCMAAFPATGKHEDSVQLQNMLKDNAKKNKKEWKQGNPVPVDAPVETRLMEVIQGRKELCVYDDKMQNELVVHFKCHHKSVGGPVRLLTHFYNFLFFEDYKQDLWTKRFVRDHVRYIDEIQCAAARVVHAIRQHVISRKDSGKNPQEGIFDTMHIRRGDFQYKNTRVDCSKIYDASKDQLKEGDTIYIATDERDKSFFNCLKDKYDILFLDDFTKEISSINTNYYGMLDQLISSRGRIFFGCWFSTFTGYITRIRGYHSVKDKMDGYKQGILPNTFYYTLPQHHDAMLTYTTGNTFAREFPNSWRDINYGIEDLGSTSTNWVEYK